MTRVKETKVAFTNRAHVPLTQSPERLQSYAEVQAADPKAACGDSSSTGNHILMVRPGGMRGYTKIEYIKMEYKPPPPHLRCAEFTEGGTGPGIKTGLGSDGQGRPKSRSRG